MSAASFSSSSSSSASVSRHIKRIQASELATLLRLNPPASDLTVIDVRERDYAGGHIRGAVNLPAGRFGDSIEEHLTRFGHVKNLVFHCMMSQIRGPSCAKHFMYNMRDGHTAQVYVLQGGFREFVRKYSHKEDLVEDYDQRYWATNGEYID
eukprot:Nk52_evm25s2622 gene=Nk52_evmTU25s2622